MELRRYKDLLAIETESGRHIGFHSRNLSIADISEEAWRSLKNSSLEARTDLDLWNKEIDENANDETHSKNIQTLSLNIAQICNLKCDYCAAGGDGTYGSDVKKIDLTKAEIQIQYFLKRASDGETFRIEFLGGEPLLFPKIIESLCRYSRLLSAGRNINLEFVMTTNGTLITNDIARMLGHYNFALTISLDGAPAINDLHRPSKIKSKSSSQMTLEGLKALSSIRQQFLYLNATSVFGAHNTSVIDTYRFLISLNIEWTQLNFNFANNPGDDEARFSSAYLKEMAQLSVEVFKESGLEGLAQIAQFRRPLSRLMSQTRTHSYCAAGKSLVLADTKADLYTCNWFMNDPSEKIGSMTTIDQQAWAAYDAELIELNDCQSCWARHLCGGGCMAVHKSFSGSKHQKNPNFCERTRTLAALSVNYFAESFS